MANSIANIAVVAFSAEGKPMWHWNVASPNVASAPVWTGAAIALVVQLPSSTPAGANNGSALTPTLVLLSPSGTEEGSYPLAALVPPGTSIGSVQGCGGGILLTLQQGTGTNVTTRLVRLTAQGSSVWQTAAQPGRIPAGDLAVVGNLVVLDTATSTADGANTQDTLRAFDLSTGAPVWAATQKRLQQGTLEAADGPATIWSVFTPSGYRTVAVATTSGHVLWTVPHGEPLGQTAWGPSQWLQCIGITECTLRSIATGATVGTVQVPKLAHLRGIAVLGISAHYVLMQGSEQIGGGPVHNYIWIVGINGRHYEKRYVGDLGGTLDYNLPNGAWIVNPNESQGQVASVYWGP